MSRGDMLVAELAESRLIRLARVQIPRPEAGEVRVRVVETGLCGSDLSTYLGRHPYKRAPTVLGHEFSGIVEAVGPGVAGWRPGDRVCAAAFSPCGTCAACQEACPHLCSSKTTFSHGGWMGSFAEQVVAKDNMLFGLPPEISFAAGALVEPLAIGLHAVRLAGLASDRSLTIIGSGNIGLTCSLAARRLGAAHITCIDINPGKEALAHACGADAFVVPAHRDSCRRSASVILACDYPEAIDDAIALTRPGGKIVLVSYFGSAMTVNANALVRGELTVVGSALADWGDFRTVIGWLAEGSLDPSALVTHRLPLRDAARAFRLMEEAQGTIGKVVLTP